MDTSTIKLPSINPQVYELLMETCMDSVLESPESDQLQQLVNLAHARLKGLVDDETLDKIENLLGDASWLYGKKMFDLGLALGLNPRNIFDLPNTNWAKGKQQ